jgi:hypothetical protein
MAHLAEDLVECLSAHEPQGLRQRQAYATTLKDLLRTLKHEPLCFEDAFFMALPNSVYDPGEAAAAAKRAAREVPSGEMCEALEAAQQEAWERIREMQQGG